MGLSDDGAISSLMLAKARQPEQAFPTSLDRPGSSVRRNTALHTHNFRPLCEPANIPCIMLSLSVGYLT
jgi:hypothetical protein